MKPIDAVTHPDPYGYYAELARRPVVWNADVGFWIVAEPAAIATVLADPGCVVRPPAEPVPRALLGSAAGVVFGRLVRMTEGAAHDPGKRAIAAMMAAWQPEDVAVAGRASGRALATSVGLDAFARRLPVHVVGRLLDVPANRLDELADLVAALVRAFAPTADAVHVARASSAVASLAALIPTDGLRHAGAWPDDETIVANAIGLLTQTYDATAGLIGNTVVALVRDAGLRRRLAADPTGIPDVVRTVLRRDPPIHNTRRWVARSGTVLGQTMAVGDGILLVLAAADRAFGAGRHACPGDRIAMAIAETGVAALLERDRIPERWTPRYRASHNARIPRFEEDDDG